MHYVSAVLLLCGTCCTPVTRASLATRTAHVAPGSSVFYTVRRSPPRRSIRRRTPRAPPPLARSVSPATTTLVHVLDERGRKDAPRRRAPEGARAGFDRDVARQDETLGNSVPAALATTVNFSRPEPIPAAASHRPTRFTTQPSPSTSRIVRRRPNKESDRVLTDSTSSIDVDGNLFATGLLGFLACSPTSQALRGERLCRLDG